MTLPDTTRMELAERLDKHRKTWTEVMVAHPVFADKKLLNDLSEASAALLQPIASDAGAVSAYKSLFEPRESDALDNLDGALIDIKRLSEAGKPTDAVCIRTIERVMAQLKAAHDALSTSEGAGTKGDQQRPQIDSSRVAESANAKSGIAK